MDKIEAYGEELYAEFGYGIVEAFIDIGMFVIYDGSYTKGIVRRNINRILAKYNMDYSITTESDEDGNTEYTYSIYDNTASTGTTKPTNNLTAGTGETF
jgi:hypothetical protein